MAPGTLVAVDKLYDEPLRIVDEELAEHCDRRRLDLRTRYLASVARADGFHLERTHGKYLLTGGMLVCPT